MRNLGFDVTPWTKFRYDATKDSINYLINQIQVVCKNAGYAIDGCVFGYDDVAYGDSLGATGHHLRSQLAFKFYDEEYETTLKNIEWQVGRTGVITPIAIFDPIDIDGTIVEKASLSNISILKNTLGIPFVGQKVWVTKRNSIIPHIERAEQCINQ